MVLNMNLCYKTYIKVWTVEATSHLNTSLLVERNVRFFSFSFHISLFLFNQFYMCKKILYIIPFSVSTLCIVLVLTENKNTLLSTIVVLMKEDKPVSLLEIKKKIYVWTNIWKYQIIYYFFRVLYRNMIHLELYFYR